MTRGAVVAVAMNGWGAVLMPMAVSVSMAVLVPMAVLVRQAVFRRMGVRRAGCMGVLVAVGLVLAVVGVRLRCRAGTWGLNALGSGAAPWAGAERQRHAVGLAGACALPFAQVAAFHQAFHMVVVALLGQAHLLFKAQHLGPVLA